MAICHKQYNSGDCIQKNFNKENSRMDLKGIGINTRNYVDWPEVRDYWRALVNAELNLRIL